MNKLKERIEQDTVALIKKITGFEETDVNFQLCKSFADSNFKYHRYLDPDSHKIHREIDGLVEKFEIHSEKQKADDFKELTNSFLESPGLGGKDTGKSDVHYAMLTLLLKLSNCPLQTDYVRKRKTFEKESLDQFDWTSYLLSDVDLNFVSYASGCSDDEEDFEESDDESTLNVHAPSEGGNLSSSAELVRRDQTQQPGSQHISFDIDHSGDAGLLYSQIEKAVVVQYWKGHALKEEVSGDHKSCQLYKQWHDYRASQCLHTPNCLVTEQQVIREILWMLNGDVQLFILPFSGGKFTLNSNVYMTHLTTECLENSLRPLMSTAGQVYTLRSFVDEVHSQVCSGLKSGVSCSVPQTYQAYASWVFQFLTDFFQELVKIEESVIRQESLISLLKLSNDLKPWLDKVQVVHGVYVEGICSQSSLVGSENNCYKASYLLDILYQLLIESSLISPVDTSKKTNFVLEMLVATSFPLFDIISKWINYGLLSDPGEEFVVRRNKEVTSLDETFWERAFISNQILPPNETSKSELSQKAVNLPSSSDISSSHLNDSIESIVSRGPDLLKSILADTILIGKSMEMLENLGRMNEVHEVCDHLSHLPPSLFDLFLNDLKSKLHISPTEFHQQEEMKSIVQSQRDGTKSLLKKTGQHDPLLDMYFDSLFCKTDNKGRRLKKKHFESALFDFTPVSKLLENCLCPVIQARYKTVCSKLVHIFKVDYNLMDCIHAIQRYFLMSSGEVMYDFYTSVFHKLQHREEWRDADILDMFLHDAVEHRYPEDVSRLSVAIISTDTTDSSPISLTNCINLKYNVPWPVNVVISEKCQEVYNNIFNFLLQMKRVKFSLDQLRFEDASQQVVQNQFNPDDDVEPVSRECKIHKCYLFRFRLLYFINSLHDYIMTRILHSSGLEFESQLEQATDLEQIMVIHGNYVQVIHERCLLHPRLAVLRAFIMKVLNLSLTFCQMWQQGVDFISYKILTDMEVELSRCIHFLSSFLNNVIKRGSFPHLASLAFAFSSSIQDEKKLIV
ncbi:gamma-tubulin complex component 5-like isoform X1 [Biomphalaria pfeifferi]|uniref:Gamma-tubulin complex component n=1 Tax=Biomphalaria pfeifferi TaxID=112525 RepID=A0AAD8F7W2_BIOPF|nr:gamma-tubulin complex component 5-like isoform X1 [Biomphalaria pfeifferi]